MSGSSPEVRVPSLVEEVTTEERILAVLNKIADSELHTTLIKQRERVIEQQKEMIAAIDALSVKMDKASNELEMAVNKLSVSVMGILQVPIAVALIGVASWAFFFKYIDQWVWLIIMAVACFRYLGDSITAIVKLVGGIRGKNGSK